MLARAGFLAVVVLLVAGAVPAFSSTPAPPGGSRPRDISALPGDPVAYERTKAKANARYARWAREHGVATAGRDTSVSGSLNQPGLAASDPPNGATPPDTTGSIGPSNYVEMVNSEIGVYSNTDLSAPTATLDELTFFHDTDPSFGGEPPQTCDGQIQWDQEGQRWLYSGLDCNAPFGHEALYVGFSKGTSPLPLDSSNWCQYTIPTGSNLEDYDKLGHDDTQIIIGANEFGNDGYGFNGGKLFVLPKPAPGTISTCPTQSAEVTNSLVTLSVPDAFTPVPADIADSSANGYVVATDDVGLGSDSTNVYLYTITPGVTSGTMSPTTTVTVPSYTAPASVPQPGGSGDTLDSLDGRLTQAVAVKTGGTGPEEIWTQHTVDGGGPSVVRWYELTPGDATPAQVGTVSGAHGAFAFMGAVSPSSDGENAAIFFNTGSSTQRADFEVDDRHAGTPSGQMVENLQLATSPKVDEDFSCESWGGGPCRWGDYNGASPDPSNASLVWGTGELTVAAPDNVSGNPQWGSENAAIDVSGPVSSYALDVSVAGSGTGSVSSGDSQISCPSTACSHSYPPSTPVTLTAAPAPGSSFDGWSGDCSGMGTCQVTMNAPHAVTATFSLVSEPLTVSKAGAGSGTVASTIAGIDCGSACSHAYDYGTSVTLTATAGTGSVFTGWSACPGTGDCTVSMTAAQNVIATFALVPETLTVTKSGSGTVASTIAGIDCGSTCSHSYDYGTSVTLTATAGTGSVFTGWSGACSGTGDCTVSMTAAQAVTATFSLVPETLTVTKSGSGTVASTIAGIDCGSTCSHSYDYGTSVTLTATAGTGSVFTGWSGACSGTGDCTVSMTAAQAVTATFSLAPETLTVTRSGSGTVTSIVAGIDCGSACSHAFGYGTNVTLAAAAAAGSRFAGWSGACSGTGGCTVSMTAARSVHATFVKLVCVVPNLKGKKLAAAKSALRAAHCGVGKVTQKTSTAVSRGKVLSQSRAPGKHLKDGAPVDLVVGKGR